MTTQANVVEQARERVAVQDTATTAPAPLFTLSATNAALVRDAAGVMALTDVERDAHVEARKAVINSLKTAGIGLPGSQDAIKREYWVGYCARRANRVIDVLSSDMLATAGAMLAKPGKDRSEDEAKTYDGARKSWSNMLKACSASTHEARGGRKPRQPGEETAPTTPAAIAVATSAPDAHAYLLLQGTTMLAYCDKNAVMVPAALKSAVADFLRAVKKWEAA